MDESCRDCLLAKSVEERVLKLEVKVCACEDAFDNRIHELEKHVAVSDEKFKQVFQKLDEIISILNKNSERLPSMVWGIAGAVASGVIMWLIR